MELSQDWQQPKHLRKCYPTHCSDNLSLKSNYSLQRKSWVLRTSMTGCLSLWKPQRPSSANLTRIMDQPKRQARPQKRLKTSKMGSIWTPGRPPCQFQAVFQRTRGVIQRWQERNYHNSMPSSNISNKCSTPSIPFSIGTGLGIASTASQKTHPSQLLITKSKVLAANS